MEDKKILSAAGLRDFHHQLFIFKHNKNKLALCFSGMFQVRSGCQNYNTRTSKARSAPIAITTRSKFFFIYRGIKLCISNGKTINDMTRFEEFRNMVKEKIYSNYEFKVIICHCYLYFIYKFMD